MVTHSPGAEESQVYLDVMFFTDISVCRTHEVCEVCWSQRRRFCFWICCAVVCCPSGRRSLWRSLTVSGMSCRSAGRRRTTPSSERTMLTTTPVSLFVLLISSSHFLCSTFYSPSLPSIITAPCHLYFLVGDLIYVFKWSVVYHDCWTMEGIII